VQSSREFSRTLVPLSALFNRYWRNRLLRHVGLAAATFCLGSLTYALLPPPDVRHRASLASGYLAVIYLTISLALGPYRVWRKLPNPVSFDLRRDIGIWAALLATLHTAVGLTVHLRGRMWMYFLESLRPVRAQLSLFGLANYLGVVATLLFLVLLLISNDFSLRTLGKARWKSIQRWSYIAAGLTVLHGFAYQVVEKRDLTWVLFLVVITALILACQLGGFSIIRLKQRLLRTPCGPH
jgi:methionine sulfoxide reductase heme-binding subunit